jgi:[ribosomal protein S5]-alanine N-acetyltransferase
MRCAQIRRWVTRTPNRVAACSGTRGAPALSEQIADSVSGERGPTQTEEMQELFSLRPVQQSDLAELMRIYTDPTVPGEFQWFGFRVAKAREVERRWAEDGLIGGDWSLLAIGLQNGSCAGVVNWRAVGETGNLEIGVCVFPEHRGQGIGTEAQRQLVGYLFATTPVHRLQAGTEVDNVAEQRALERVGFRREGVSRGLYFRDGRWRDSIMYGLLRDDTSRDVASSAVRS